MKSALTWEGHDSNPSPAGDLPCDLRQAAFPSLTSVSPLLALTPVMKDVGLVLAPRCVPTRLIRMSFLSAGKTG